jgi:hypothetical protein
MRLTLFLCALTACAMEMGVVTPRPMVNLGVTTQSLAMVLPPTVAESFTLESDAGWKLRVLGFRSSVQNGWAAAFQRYYRLTATDADLALRFDAVSLDVYPRLALRYSVELDDRQGRAVGRSFGTLTPRQHVIGQESELLDELLTTMFEKIAADCFVPLSVVSSAARP